MLLYLDNLDAVPVQSEPGTNAVYQSTLTQDAARWTNLTLGNSGGGVFSSNRSGAGLWVASAPLPDMPPLTSERQLHFRAFRSGGPAPGNFFCKASIQAKNKNVTHVIGGLFAYKRDTVGIEPIPIVGWNDGLTIPNTDASTFWKETGLYIDSNGYLNINGTTGATHLAQNTGHFIEVKLDPVNKEISVFLSGHIEIDKVSVSSLEEVDEIAWMTGGYNYTVGEGVYFAVDNMYFLDDTGAFFNSRLGPINVQRLPFDDEDAVTWTPEGGAASNIAAVNKTTLATTTHNRSPGTNDKADTFTVDTSGIDPNATILGVVTCSFAAKSDIGDRSLDGIAKKNGQTVREGFGDHFSSVYQGSNQLVMHEAPDGTAWDISAIDNTVFGYEVKA